MNNPFEPPKYLQKFGLKEPPYTTNPDERYLYLTESHQEAISMCGRLIQNREGAGLIVGDQGTGKTTIMRRLTSLMRSGGEFHTAVIETAEHCPSIFQLSKEILESFGEECVGRDTKTRIDQLKTYLLDAFVKQKVCVLFIDEAQQMKGSLLESLRGLLNFEDPAAGGKLLQIILLAMPGINRKLRFAPSFSNRIVKTELNRMSKDEAQKMLAWRFAQAEGRFFPFDQLSLDEIYKQAKGNPRTMCGIAQIALEIAGTTDQALTTQVIQEIAQKRIAN